MEVLIMSGSVFVSRDGDGKITGTFANRQLGVADEELANDSPQVVSFLTPASSFKAREFFALLTADDFTAIATATAGSASLGLLWASLQAQGEAPIYTSSSRFQAGWAAIVSTLGSDRAAQIAQALKITIP
jgi:hypothetical protein